MNASRQTDDHVIVQTLTLLGLNDTIIKEIDMSHANKTCMKITQKGGHEILFFLFTRINKKKSQKVFRDCWPTFDKKMESAFRTACFKWYKELNQDGDLGKPKVVHSVASITPGSNKFRKTLMSLASCAMMKTISKTDPSTPVLYPPNGSLNTNAVVLKLLISTKEENFNKFLAEERKQHENLIKMKTIFSETTSELKQMTAQNNEMEKIIKEKLSSMPFDLKTDDPLPCLLQKATQVLERRLENQNKEIGDLFSRVSSLHDVEKQSRHPISVLVEASGVPTFEGADLLKCIGPNPQKRYPEIFVDGELDLVSILQASLPHITKMSDSAPRNTKDADMMNEMSLRVDSTFAPFMKVQAELTQKADGLSTQVNNLKNQVHNLMIQDSDKQEMYELCPPTPSYTFPSKTPKSNRMKQRNHLTPSEGKENQDFNNIGYLSPNRLFHTPSFKHKKSLEHMAVCNSQRISMSPQVTCSVYSPKNADSAFGSDLDSLLHSIEKINTTSKKRPSAGFESLGLQPKDSGCGAALGTSFLSLSTALSPLSPAMNRSTADIVCEIDDMSKRLSISPAPAKDRIKIDDLIDYHESSISRESENSKINLAECFRSFETFLDGLDDVSISSVKKPFTDKLHDGNSGKHDGSSLESHGPSFMFETMTEALAFGEFDDNLSKKTSLISESQHETVDTYRRKSLLSLGDSPDLRHKSIFTEEFDISILDESESCLITFDDDDDL